MRQESWWSLVEKELIKVRATAAAFVIVNLSDDAIFA